MPITSKVEKLGNGGGLILTSEMLAHLGIEDQVVVTYETGRIVLSAPDPEARLTPGRTRQNTADALHSTFAQYEDTLQRLAEVPGSEPS